MTHSTGRTGHLYAIEFSSGTVKVGQTQDATRRIASHLAAAKAHGVTAGCVWVSEPVDHLDERERELLAFCEKHWLIATGSEYFLHADITKIVKQANRNGAPTRDLSGKPLKSPNAGTSYVRRFEGHPASAAEVRTWARKRTNHPDAPQIANELFVSILDSGADAIEVILSIAGYRLRISATGSIPLHSRHSHGPGWRIVAGLAQSTGVTSDECGLWAQLGSD